MSLPFCVLQAFYKQDILHGPPTFHFPTQPSLFPPYHPNNNNKILPLGVQRD